MLRLQLLHSMKNNTALFSGTIPQLVFILAFPLLISQDLYRDTSSTNKRYRGDIFNLLTQVPVKKKDILNFKFIIFLFVTLPGLIVTVYFSIVNIFISSTDMISAYSGFFVLIFIITFILFSASIGFNSIKYKKFKFIKLLPIFYLGIFFSFFIYSIFIPFTPSNTKVTPENMYNALGPIFAPFFKACRYLGGLQGLIILILSIFVGYYLCCKLTLKISEKVG